jgi:S1-C subfamily serine protease
MPVPLLVLWLLSAGADAAGAVPDRTAAELAARIKPSVVVLEVLDASGEIRGNGTGFLVSSDGVTVTNVHVVQEAQQMRAVLADGSKRQALGVLAQDEDRDVALIKLEGAGYPALPLGETGTLTEGAPVMVVGSPLGLASTVSLGIVSAVRRELPAELTRRAKGKLGALVQITAPVSPGSSGSPVVTMDGRVIGVTQGQMTIGQNINFAVPIEVAKDLLASLPRHAAPQPFRPFPLGNAIASAIFLFLLASTLVALKVRGWLRARRRPRGRFGLEG